jgi:hypothetical protein
MGCCLDGVCQAGDSTSACGSGGNLCDTCVGAQICNGRCEDSTAVGGGGAGGTGGGAGGGGTGGGGAMSCTPDTWSSFGAAFFSGHCAGCHGTFTHSGVQSAAALYSSFISSGSMPRGGGISASLRAEAVTYLNCGAP